MNHKYLEVLRSCEYRLITDIIVADIIPMLRKCSYFTLKDEEYINHEITSKAKAVKLLNIIREKDQECFKEFLRILSTTNTELYNMLEEGINTDGRITKRSCSPEACKEIMIKGGVPVQNNNYISRPVLENQVLHLIKSNSRKPILVHGIIGSGKTSIISQILRNKELFEENFLNCCWMTIGNINESVVNKLQTLLKKLSFNKKCSEITMSSIPELLMEDIKKQLSERNTLLIVHDVRSLEVMKYFTFNEKYIVISTMSNLFPRDTAHEVYIPEFFTDEQCNKLIKNKYDIQNNSIVKKIIQKSGKHPMYLDWICHLVKNKDGSDRLIDQLDFDKHTISKQCIDALGEDIRDYFIMLMILPYGGTISSELLSIYWDVGIQETSEIIRQLCNNSLMKKSLNSKYNCIMYGVYNFYLYCLKNSNHKENLKIYENLLVTRFIKKFSPWITFDIQDPFFFIFYGKVLYKSNDFQQLTKLYSDYSFIASKIAICGINELVYDYEKYRPPALADKWNEFETFLIKNSHIFHKLSLNKAIKVTKIFTTLIQRGLYELKESFIYKSAYENRKLSGKEDFWDLINPQKSIKIWENTYEDHIELADIMNDYLLMSTIEGRIILVELNCGICLFNYKISENPIILVKFIANMDVLVIDSKAQFWLFKPNDLDSGTDNLILHYDEKDPPFSMDTNSNHLHLFKNYFENLLLNNLINKCKIKTDDDEELDGVNLKAQMFHKKIYFFNNCQRTIITYDLTYQKEDSFSVKISIKKGVLISDGFWYFLQPDGIITLFDESNESYSNPIIQNEAIVDFTVVGKDIFYVTRNKVYRNNEEFLFIGEHLTISKISMSNGLLILYLSCNYVRIYSGKELIYSLHDSQLTNAFILHNDNILITISETNVAKWKVDDLNKATTYNPNQFIMEKLNSSWIMVLQTTKNELEFHTYNNGQITVETVHQESIATCFSCLDDLAIIGFKSGIFEIYNLLTFKKICQGTLKSSTFEIISLATYRIDKSNIGILVHHSGNEIMIYNFNEKNSKIVNSLLVVPKNVPKCNFFQIKESALICGVYNDESCTLYKIFENTFLNIGYYDFGENIIDFDISADIKYLCMISTKGLLKIWEISVSKLLISIEGNYGILRKCKFRPRHNYNHWRLVAIINDNAQIYLHYFCGNKWQINLLIEEFASTVNQIPRTLEWSFDSLYLLVGDYSIKKWKIPIEPHNKEQVKLASTILQTYFGGIQCIQVQDNFIATVDQQGFLYVLKKLN